MIFDFDDHCEANNAMPYMTRLKEINPAFKATLFAIPAHGDEDFWNDHPDWIELAGHGWSHPDPREAEHWSYDQAVDVLLALPERFVDGWKSPGWLSSPGVYDACRDMGFWIADQHLADGKRPVDLPAYLWEDGDNWHGHVQNVCGNGLGETWSKVCELVERAGSFEFASDGAAVLMMPL